MKPSVKPIRIGVGLPSKGSVATAENILQVARWAHELGYDSAWASDHIAIPSNIRSRYPGAPDGVFPYGPLDTWLDPLITLTWVAASVPTLSVGTSVLIVPLRNPFLIAKQVATLANLSGGRFVLGVGTGWMEEEFEVVGASFGSRLEATVAAIAIMRRLWTGNLVNGAGIGPPLGLPVKVLWGGYKQTSLQHLVRYGDGWIGAGAPSWFAQGAAYVRAQCESLDRDPLSLDMIARPGEGVLIDPEMFQFLSASGATEVVVDPPFGLGLGACHEALARAAEAMQRMPRTRP